MLRQGAKEYLHLARMYFCWRDGLPSTMQCTKLSSAHCKGPMQLPTAMLPSVSKDDAPD